MVLQRWLGPSDALQLSFVIVGAVSGAVASTCPAQSVRSHRWNLSAPEARAASRALVERCRSLASAATAGRPGTPRTIERSVEGRRAARGNLTPSRP